MSSFFQPAHMPCAQCGASLARAERAAHSCDPERALDYLLVQLRDEIAAFDAQLASWLSSVAGRFECWYAERSRRGGFA
jgi:hypothetical protein